MIMEKMNLIRQLLANEGPTKSTLRKIEKELLSLASDGDFSQYRRAAPGEEVTHMLDIAHDGGASLYLVSDGHGVVTLPHRHETWAVIVGIEGREMNQRYSRKSMTSNEVEQIGISTIGPKDSIIMNHDEIHGTVSIGPDATFHLHLYGVDLASLPSISQRTYRAVPLNT